MKNELNKKNKKYCLLFKNKTDTVMFFSVNIHSEIWSVVRIRKCKKLYF